MFIIRCLGLTLLLTCFNGLDALAAENDAALLTHNTFTQELAHSSQAYKIAKSTFLPETYDDLGLSGRYNTKYDFNNNSCDAYTLPSCPAHGKCIKCPFNSKKLKLSSCDKGYSLNGNKCTVGSCTDINSSYKTERPVDYYCTKVTGIDITCYKNCRPISCSGYTLDCNNQINDPNSNTLEICPDCYSGNANCSKNLCKIASCKSGYKVNAAGTACVEKNDTCPTGYYKSCRTGRQGDPVYTEKGTACYQCKANTTTENIKVTANFSKSCPAGLTFKLTPQGGSAVTCSSSQCYEYDGSGSTYAPDGGHSNETESIVTVGSTITLSDIPSAVNEIYNVSTKTTYPISGTTYSFKANSRDTVIAGVGQDTNTGLGAYDFWTLKCKSNTPQRACSCGNDKICLYYNNAGNYCFGPECSETEYPHEKTDYCSAPSCIVAPTYGQWCSMKTCSRDNPLCQEIFSCGTQSDKNTCSIHPNLSNLYSDDTCQISCEITGDYSAYECPQGQKCLFDYYNFDSMLPGRCVDASISDKDIDKAIIDITQTACPNLLAGNDDTRLVVFYTSDVNIGKVLTALDGVKSGSTIRSGEKIISRDCLGNAYSTCKYSADQLQQCKYSPAPSIETESNLIVRDFCSMNYCAINLSESHQIDAKTQKILDTYVRYHIDGLISIGESEYSVAAYNIHADNKTVSYITNMIVDTSTGKDISNPLAYLNGCGACTNKITAYKKYEDETHKCTKNNTDIYSLSIIEYYKMYYNPDTIKNYEGKLTNKTRSCYNAIGTQEMCPIYD